MPNQQSFVRNRNQGSTGNKFVDKHICELLSYDLILNPKDVQGLKIGGADGYEGYARFGETVVDDPPWMGEERLTGGRQIIELTQGNSEKKTVWSFLFRTNDNSEPSGTVGFELWSSDKRKKAGWLPGYMHPERYLEIDKDGNTTPQFVQPAVLFFLLMAYDMPFACIAFENFGKLSERLKEIGRELKLDPENPPADMASYDGGALIIDNMWHVPFSRISDLAVVTMIGDKPRLRPDITIINSKEACTNGTQQARYDYLVSCANERHMEQDSSFIGKFELTVEQQAYANVVYDLDALGHLDETRYPALAYLGQNYRTRNIFRSLNMILECMLSLGKPQYQTYFLMSHRFFRDWCKSQGVSVGLISIEAHKKHLVNLGLLSEGRAILSGQKRAATTLSANRFTDDVLERADHIAAQQKAKNLSGSRMTKSRFISAYGQIVADQLYPDNRTESAVEKELWGMIQKETKKQIKKQGYAQPAVVWNKVWEKAGKDHNFDSFDPWEPDNPSFKYSKTLNRLKPNLRQIMAEIGCSYHPIKKEERKAFGLPDEFRGWIITQN